jgi:hypothetical protein
MRSDIDHLWRRALGAFNPRNGFIQKITKVCSSSTADPTAVSFGRSYCSASTAHLILTPSG